MSKPFHTSVCNFLGDAPATCFLVELVVGNFVRPKDLAYFLAYSIFDPELKQHKYVEVSGEKTKIP